MAVHLLRDLEHLKEHLLYLGSLVEESTDKAIASLLDRNADLAREVIEGDDRIDVRVRGDETILRTLDDVMDLVVNPAADKPVPLNAVASFDVRPDGPPAQALKACAAELSRQLGARSAVTRID